MIRENDEVEYTLEFKENEQTKSKYNLKEYNTYINIIIITRFILKNNNSIMIEYLQRIDQEEYNYRYYLKWEEIK